MLKWINWFPFWKGLRFHKWTRKQNGDIARLISWSMMLGYFELRYTRKHWRPKNPSSPEPQGPS